MLLPKKIAMTILKPILLISICGFLTSSVFADNTIDLVDGTQVVATIQTVAADGTLKGTGVPEGTKLENIVSYQTDTQVIAGGTTEVLIVGQGKLFTTSIAIADSTAMLTSSDGSPMEVPLDLIGGIVFKRTELVEKQLANRSDSEDSIVVDTPDGEKVVSGFFEGLAEGKLGLKFNGKSRKIGVEKISAVSLADLGLKNLSGTRLELSDGSKLNGRIVGIEDGRLEMSVTANLKLEIPWASVTRLEIESDNQVYLSTLEPLEVEMNTMFAPERSWQRDLSVESNPIQLQGPKESSPRVFRRGIGTQSYSEIKFANTNEFQRFQAIAGIDVETQGRGDCLMSVYADGIKLWSQRVTAQTAPAKIDVDITGMQTVTLIVEPGEQFDLADHANWADAKFVKE